MRIAILTSSRADYGIYLPLLKKLREDTFFDLKIIAFGTHLSHFHGYTLHQIEKDGFQIFKKLETLILGDSEAAISNAMGNTITKFSSLWNNIKGEVDLILALGDRYEMFAAVAASVPFNFKIAHIHGGETTLGAIDNKFRHTITLMSTLHFTSTANYAKKVAKLIGSKRNIYNVGALSLDNLKTLKLLSIKQFKKQFNIDLSIQTILTTFHPETVFIEKNIEHVNVLAASLSILSKRYQVVITMPNMDTMGNLIRERLSNLIDKNPNIIGIESFGTLGYFSCIKDCSFLLGNTSSGIIEAASLGKYVINLGNRQKGRAISKNVLNTSINKKNILNNVKKIEGLGFNFEEKNIYYHPDSANQIVKVLKKYND